MANNETVLERKKGSNLLKNANFILLLTLIVIVVIVGIFQPKFVGKSNIINLFQTVSITGIMALGMSMVIITGGIDLSVASMVSFLACLMALLLQRGILNDATAMPFGIAVGLLCGILNGVLVAYTHVEPFIITLGTMSMFQGAALVTANGTVVTIGDAFSWFGTIRWLTIPIQIYIFIILAVVVFLVMKYTKYGRRLYAIGGNTEAARLAGINIRRNKFTAYVVNGLFCSIAAMIVLSKLSAANANMASGYEMQAITACVVGGVSLSGGKGNTVGCFMGIMLIGIISNALNLLYVPTFYHKIIIGAVLLFAVILRTGRSNNN